MAVGKAIRRGVALAVCVLGVATAQAHEDEVAHFEGLPAETVAEAVEHLDAYTEQLVALAEGDLGPTDMAEVHEITYTLENALARLDAEYEAIAVALEEVHLASERADTETVREHSAVYAEKLSEVMPAQ